MAQLQERGLSFPNYTKFFETIKAFREQAAVPWEDFDKYLWLYGQKRALDKGSRAINKEVRVLYDSPEGRTFFERLED